MAKELTNEQIVEVAKNLLVGKATLEDLPVGIVSDVDTKEIKRYWSPFDQSNYYDKNDPEEKFVELTLKISFSGKATDLAHIFRMKKVSFIPRDDK